MTKEECKLMTDNFIKMLDRIDEINKKMYKASSEKRTIHTSKQA